MTEAALAERALSALEQTLERTTALNTLAWVRGATQAGAQTATLTLEKCAVCLDTNVYLKLVGMSNSEEIIDFLGARQEIPLLVSAQAMQEVWNNQLNGITTLASDVREKLIALEKSLSSAYELFPSYKERFEQVLLDFKSEYGHLHADSVRDKIKILLEMLEVRALFCEVPRFRFGRYASVRHQTKTPPGFKDDGDGDFFIWLDFLYGLRMLRDRGIGFERAIFVSGDRKVDWVRGGVAHPTLAAECMSYVGASLEIWTTKQLAMAVAT